MSLSSPRDRLPFFERASVFHCVTFLKGHRHTRKKEIYLPASQTCFSFFFVQDCHVDFCALKDAINMHVNLHTNSGIFKYAGYVMNY